MQGTSLQHVVLKGIHPASANSQNVPYFQTHLNTGIQNQGESVWALPWGANPPSGVQPTVYADEDDNTCVYWCMWSQTYVSTVPSNDYGTMGNGIISNPDAIEGAPDYICAGIYGGNYGDGAWIKAEMNAPSGGNIYAIVSRGYSAAGYYSNLYVYVSTDGTHWNWVNNNYITVSSNYPGWISIGLPYMGDFTWIAVVGYDTYDSVNLNIDAVMVNCDPAVTILAYDESSSSYVNSIPISVDGTWVPSGDVISLTSGDNQFQAFDSTSGGAFNCFYDGSNYYSNGQTSISGDETITAYYNYIPTYSVYFYAYDPGAGSVYVGAYVDGNYVGTTYCVVTSRLAFIT